MSSPCALVRIGRNGQTPWALAPVRRRQHDRDILAVAAQYGYITPRASTASAVSALIVGEDDRDMHGGAIPRPEIHLAVRFGPNARHGLDAHALGVREKAVRKLIRSG